jgi:hypothetical protein
MSMRGPHRKKVSAFALLLELAVVMVLLSAPTVVSAGVPIGSRFVVSNNNGWPEVNPAIAYNTQRQEYLVVWYNDRAGCDDIQAQRVSRGGTLVGSPFFIAATCPDERRYPDVAYDSTHDQYLVVWEQGIDVKAKLISATGAGLTLEFTVAAGYPTLDSASNPHVAYASTSDQYLVIWQYSGTAGSSIDAQVYEYNGAPNGSSFDVIPYRFYASESPPEEPDLAYNRSRNEFLVAWQQEPPGGDYDIYGQRVKLTGGAGVQGSAFPVATSGTDETNPAVAAIPTVPNAGQYLVAWEKGTDVEARTVSGVGTTGTLRSLASTGWTEHSPAVAGCESTQQFLAVWVWIPVVTPPAMMQVQARTLALDGTLVDDTTNAGGGQVFAADVAAGPTGDVLVAFDDNATIGTSNRGIYGRLWGHRVYFPVVMRSYTP